MAKERPELMQVPLDTHKPCRKTCVPGFPCTPSNRHHFPFELNLSFTVRSGSDLNCAEIACFHHRIPYRYVLPAFRMLSFLEFEKNLFAFCLAMHTKEPFRSFWPYTGIAT